MRKINLYIQDNKSFKRVSEITQRFVAIGYLTTWALVSGAYNEVDIMPNGEFDMVATYRGEEQITFVIGAIWDKVTNTYSFHS